MIRNKALPERRAIRAAKWSFSFLFAAIYFAILRMSWELFDIKLGDTMYFLMLFATVFLSWHTFHGFFYNEVNKAKKIVKDTYPCDSIQFWGWVGAFIVGLAPLCLLIAGILLISGYRKW